MAPPVSRPPTSKTAVVRSRSVSLRPTAAPDLPSPERQFPPVGDFSVGTRSACPSISTLGRQSRDLAARPASNFHSWAQIAQTHAPAAASRSSFWCQILPRLGPLPTSRGEYAARPGRDAHDRQFPESRLGDPELSCLGLRMLAAESVNPQAQLVGDRRVASPIPVRARPASEPRSRRRHVDWRATHPTSR